MVLQAFPSGVIMTGDPCFLISLSVEACQISSSNAS